MRGNSVDKGVMPYRKTAGLGSGSLPRLRGRCDTEWIICYPLPGTRRCEFRVRRYPFSPSGDQISYIK